jgi:hypothetical protein
VLPPAACSGVKQGHDYAPECANESETAQDKTVIGNAQANSKHVCDATPSDPDEDDPDTVMQEREGMPCVRACALIGRQVKRQGLFSRNVRL